MPGAKLNGADLTETHFRGANLNGADVRTLAPRSGPLIVTDLSRSTWLVSAQVKRMLGDRATMLPARLSRPETWPEASFDRQVEADIPHQALDAPLVRASAMDFAFTEQGIEAHVADDQAIFARTFTGDCGDRSRALIENARHIAVTLRNHLAQNIRDDLNAYAHHLETAQPANPHRLSFLATGIEADLEDEFRSEGFDTRAKRHLRAFLIQHRDFMDQCVPNAAEAIRVKRETRLDQPISKAEVTDALDRPESAIAQTDAATASVAQVLAEMRRHDDALNTEEIRVYSGHDQHRFGSAVEAEAKEVITHTSRLYWRARAAQMWRAAEAMQMAVTISGKTVPEIARILTEALTPLMHGFGQLLQGLPPL